MRGVRALVKMRLEGSVPDFVWIDTNPLTYSRSLNWERFDNSQAHLEVEEDEKIDRIDMRCVHGLVCFIDGCDVKSVHQMRDNCIRSGAKRVIAAVVHQYGKDEFVAFRCVESSDTLGQLVWGAD